MADLPAQSSAIRIWSVGLRLRGQRLDPDAVTAESGLTPSAARQPASRHWDLDGTWLDCDMPGHWSFATTNVLRPGSPLDDHLRILFGAEAEKTPLWRRLAREYELHVWICVSSDPDARPPRLDEVLALATPAFAAAVRALPGRIRVDAI